MVIQIKPPFFGGGTGSRPKEREGPKKRLWKKKKVREGASGKRMTITSLATDIDIRQLRRRKGRWGRGKIGGPTGRENYPYSSGLIC